MSRETWLITGGAAPTLTKNTVKKAATKKKAWEKATGKAAQKAE